MKIKPVHLALMELPTQNTFDAIVIFTFTTWSSPLIMNTDTTKCSYLKGQWIFSFLR